MDWIKIFSDEAEARNKIQDNKPQLLIVNGIRICLTLHNNTFFAVQDACPHQGESLSKGAINYLGELICPLHNYRFDLQSGRECATRSRDLKTFPIKADESGIFIGL
jgi:nitrite reductase/ring-hydroxylating ferredoxin subunit